MALGRVVGHTHSDALPAKISNRHYPLLLETHLSHTKQTAETRSNRHFWPTFQLKTFPIFGLNSDRGPKSLFRAESRLPQLRTAQSHHRFQFTLTRTVADCGATVES